LNTLQVFWRTLVMKIETHHAGKRYTLSNDNLANGDLVYPIARGRCLGGDEWILHEFTFNKNYSDFPDNPHTIINTKNNISKPYEVRTNFGYGPREIYYKIIKIEEQVIKSTSMFGVSYEWAEIK
jgi:hypothetical protein